MSKMRKKIVLYIIISALMLIFAITEINKGSEKGFLAVLVILGMGLYEVSHRNDENR